MKRRDFIRLAAGAAVWPISARAQQARMVDIGFVTWGSPAIQMRVEDLRQGLRDFGYVEGTNYRLESHFTDGNKERTREIIQALVARPVDILVVWQTPAAHIAKESTKTIPIVMMVADALATGIVPGLSRPGATSPASPTPAPNSPASGWNCCVRSGRSCAPSLFWDRPPIKTVRRLRTRRRLLRKRSG